jgi:hypothetical protein
MKSMRFCLYFLATMLAAAALSMAADADVHQGVTVRGKLIVEEGKPTVIETPDHQRIRLDGDNPTRKVLGDSRLNGFDVQARGHYTAPGQFTIDPIHTHGFTVNRDGHVKMVTYWCDVCSIRAYTPGPCVCCQQETTLDLRDPDQDERK